MKTIEQVAGMLVHVSRPADTPLPLSVSSIMLDSADVLQLATLNRDDLWKVIDGMRAALTRDKRNPIVIADQQFDQVPWKIKFSGHSKELSLEDGLKIKYVIREDYYDNWVLSIDHSKGRHNGAEESHFISTIEEGMQMARRDFIKRSVMTTVEESIDRQIDTLVSLNEKRL